MSNSESERAVAQALVDLADAFLFKHETVQRQARFYLQHLGDLPAHIIRAATAEVIRTSHEFPRVALIREIALRMHSSEVSAERAREADNRPLEQCDSCGSTETFWRDPAPFDAQEYVVFVRRNLGWEKLLEFKHRENCPRRRSLEWPLPDDTRVPLRIVS